MFENIIFGTVHQRAWAGEDIRPFAERPIFSCKTLHDQPSSRFFGVCKDGIFGVGLTERDEYVCPGGMVKEGTEAIGIYNKVPVKEYAFARQVERAERKAMGGVSGPELGIPNQHDMWVIAGAMVDDQILTVADDYVDPRDMRFKHPDHAGKQGDPAKLQHTFGMTKTQARA
jgi:hypothetical protein